MISIDRIKESLTPIFKSYQIEKAMLFGSVARGEDTPSSDIDILISSKTVFDLDKLCDFEESITKAVGRNVDIVFADYINPYMKDSIMNEAVNIYDEQ